MLYPFPECFPLGYAMAVPEKNMFFQCAAFILFRLML
jgi:hypothetical protein